MWSRARSEGGFLTVELMVALVVVTVALLALMASYDEAFLSVHSSAKTSAAGLIAENQLELYASLPYASVGLDTSTLNSVKSTNTTYTSDESALPGTGVDVTITSCGSSAQCSPVQTVTGTDHRSYTLETFIRYLVNVTNADGTTRSEKVVTVIVRDRTTGSKLVTMQTAFDQGPPS